MKKKLAEAPKPPVMTENDAIIASIIGKLPLINFTTVSGEVFTISVAPAANLAESIGNALKQKDVKAELEKKNLGSHSRQVLKEAAYKDAQKVVSIKKKVKK